MNIDKWERALVGLTPGGSEFCGDPDNCVRFIKEMQLNNHKMLTEAIKENRKLKRMAVKFSVWTKLNTRHLWVNGYLRYRLEEEVTLSRNLTTFTPRELTPNELYQYWIDTYNIEP